MQRTREAIHDVDACSVFASLQRADVGAIDLGSVGELLL